MFQVLISDFRMFFLHEMERTISLHPSFFGPKNHEYLIQQLMTDVEGKNTGSYFIVCVMDTFDISDGRIVPGKAYAEYTIHFKAIVWKPFKGEIVGISIDAQHVLLTVSTVGWHRHVSR